MRRANHPTRIILGVALGMTARTWPLMLLFFAGKLYLGLADGEPFDPLSDLLPAFGPPLIFAGAFFGAVLAVLWLVSARQRATAPRVPPGRLSMNADDLVTLDGKPFTGVEEQAHAGVVLSETAYVGGRRHGWRLTRREDAGSLKSEEYLRRDVLHGMSRHTYEFGQLKSLEMYEHGICMKMVVWDQFGEVVERHVLEDDALGEDEPAYAPDPRDRATLDAWEAELDAALRGEA